MLIPNIAAHARFSPEKMGKVTVTQGAGLMLGLNCFEDGQEHSAHTHAGQDKLYIVVQGTAEIQVSEERETLGPGGVAYAASGVVHAIRNPGPERLIVMAILAPPPSK